MERRIKLTISGVLGVLLLAGCTVEVSPPTDSDAAAGPENSNPAGPVVEAPAQPSGPQPWSRDLDFEAGPAKIERGQLAEGLVPTGSSVTYSEQRLTYQSAFEEERNLTPAEQARQRALERAAAAGLPPPPATAPPPVESVSSAPLPPPGSGADGQAAPRRESRLPPPPKFPPVAPKQQAEAAEPQAEASTSAETPTASPAATDWRASRLPPPPKFPPLAPKPAEGEAVAADAAGAVAGEPQVAEAPASQTAVVAAAEPEPVPASRQASQQEPAVFVAEAWDAPGGTILVQVSAIPDGSKVMSEWHRLQTRYPEVLKPLRLVVEEARLGDRGVFYRVQAGAFGSEAAAAQACDTLMSLGQSCFVVVR